MPTNNYLKIPNQGNLMSNLRLLYEMELASDYADSQGYYTKRDIAEIAANALLITTGSSIGSDVIATLDNADIEEGDNSALQNAKMRMQILRILGLVSADYNSEIYAITELGKLIVSDKLTQLQKTNLLMELFMSITSSSECYNFTCEEGFHCYIGIEICYVLACLDYRISVDEMPVVTTYDYRQLGQLISDFKQYREQGRKFPKNDAHFPKTAKGTPLAQPSNLTRTINQILRHCGIIENKTSRIGGSNYYVCTEYGKKYVNEIRRLVESQHGFTFITPFNFRKLNILDQRKITQQSFSNLSYRAKIDNAASDDHSVFSPYQLLPETNVLWLLNKNPRRHPDKSDNRVNALNSLISAKDLRLNATYKANIDSHIESSAEKELVDRIIASTTASSVEEFIDAEIDAHKNDDKYKFYPYIHSLLRIIGLDCKGEVGRFDAYSYYKEHVVPVEIKSPTETISYNQKGIRQAIENKICSYNAAITDDIGYASLVVGYTHPDNDSEIKELIDMAREIFQINVIAIDMRSLLQICCRMVLSNMVLDLDALLTGYGLIIE